MTARPPGLLARLLLAVLALAAAAAPPAAAQSSFRGRVVLDGRGVGGVDVEVHRVSGAAQGVVARTTSGADGAFSAALPPPDTAGFSLVFATATRGGVRYFGPALPQGQPSDGYEVAVHDTTSAPAAADSVRVARRDLFLVPLPEGGWQAAEVVRLRNASRRTIVPGGRPAVGITLPAGVEAFEAGAEDEADEAAAPPGVARVGDRAWITGPLLPGERGLFLRYRFPASARGAVLSPAEGADTFHLYVPRGAPALRVTGLLNATTVRAEGEELTRYGAGALRPGASVTLEWGAPESERGRATAWGAVAAVAAIAAIGGAVLVARRRRAAG